MDLQILRDKHRRESLQAARLSITGNILEETGGGVDLSKYHVQSLFTEIPFFTSMQESMELLTDRSDPLVLSCVELELEGSNTRIYDVTITKQGVGKDEYLLLLYDLTEFYQQLQVMQQDRNEISILKEAIDEKNESLKKLNKDLDRFANQIAHDLRNPVSAAINFLQILEESLTEISASDKELLDDTIIALRRSMDIIRGLHDYARVGKEKGNVSRMDVFQSLERIIKTLNVPDHIQVEVKGPFPVFETQRIMLELVFQNLIDNAIKYNDKEKGSISISCQDMTGHYKFLVTDNGPGIPEEHHDMVFGMFQSVPGNENAQSSGIGLATVEKIVKDKGGKIWIESNAGEGTTFAFTWK